MATGQTLINRALRLLGQIPAGASPTTTESDDALIALNAMIGSWNNEALLCYAIRDESITMVASQASYTVGAGGDLNTTRPVSLDGAYVVLSGVSYHVTVIDHAQYAAIQVKATLGDFPDRVYYQPSMATGTIYPYPVPNAASVLHILTRTPLAALTLVGTVSLPPGWEEALATNLAIALAPEYETEPRQSVIKMAVESKAGIKRTNFKPIKSSTELVGMFNAPRNNIETDQ